MQVKMELMNRVLFAPVSDSWSCSTPTECRLAVDNNSDIADAEIVRARRPLQLVRGADQRALQLARHGQEHCAKERHHCSHYMVNTLLFVAVQLRV